MYATIEYTFIVTRATHNNKVEMEDMTENERQRMRTREHTRRWREKQQRQLEGLQKQVEALEKVALRMQEQHTPSYAQLVVRTEALMRQNEFFRVELLRRQSLYSNLLNQLPSLPAMEFDPRLYDVSFLYTHMWKEFPVVEAIDLTHVPPSFEMSGWTLRASTRLKPHHVLYDVRKQIDMQDASMALALSWFMLTDTPTFLSLSDVFRRHVLVHFINHSIAVVHVELALPTCTRLIYLLCYRHGAAIYFVGLHDDLTSHYNASVMRFLPHETTRGYLHVSTGQHVLQTTGDDEAADLMQMHLFLQLRWEHSLCARFEPLVVDAP
ncbi:Aste57867_9650 [Aphanomyces stellatus]|uniref:Aste57867_9650 protein n=1 Tax=Aphanomyces stellatus TaxID=120398 RepID=A0A485KNP3_9STRA|nr:hypothetical protein As57867_009612 [Aphanomyces stellatus]VFT86529.1 Aste57867_9650 [Aphanomyces stellatus]